MRIWWKELTRRLGLAATVRPLRRAVQSLRRHQKEIPPVGLVDFGSLRRLDPISRDWGDDRGRPIDRYYIEGFLKRNRTSIRGRVLEIAEDVYTRRFGGEKVTRIDILEYEEGEHPRATIVGDLETGETVPSDAFDCVIVTQTLQLIFDLRSAVGTIHRILKPGGSALVTVPGISPINRHDSESWGDYWCWSFTVLSMRKLFEEFFDPKDITVRAYGNVLTSAAFLYGLSQEELSRSELEHHDPDYEMLITVRAVKSEIISANDDN